MLLCVSPSKLNGEFTVPGSKSHTIRALAIATMTDGVSVIRMPLVSVDTLACVRTASALGAWIHRGNDTDWRVHGNCGHILTPAKRLYLENSGTGLRIFTALAALTSDAVSFSGDQSLSRRQMEPLLKALGKLGVTCESEGGHCPLTVRGPILGGETNVDGTSSQYATALLLACPLAKNDTILNLPFLNERPYVEMTLDWLKRQNIQVKYDKSLTRFHITGGQKYHTFVEQIPGDFSSAAFPIAAAVITGGNVRINNLNFNDRQGDKALIDLLAQMGAKIQKGADYVSISAPKARLHAVELDLNAVPDLLPILAVVAACADGITVLKNVKQARLKESDRIAVMAKELSKMGIQVVQFEDGLAVTGGTLTPAHVNSYYDHRVAMALAVAGMACGSGTSGMTVIDDAECIDVTYPTFVRDFINAGAAFNLCSY